MNDTPESKGPSLPSNNVVGYKRGKKPELKFKGSSAAPANSAEIFIGADGNTVDLHEAVIQEIIAAANPPAQQVGEPILITETGVQPLHGAQPDIQYVNEPILAEIVPEPTAPSVTAQPVQTPQSGKPPVRTASTETVESSLAQTQAANIAKSNARHQAPAPSAVPVPPGPPVATSPGAPPPLSAATTGRSGVDRIYDEGFRMGPASEIPNGAPTPLSGKKMPIIERITRMVAPGLILDPPTGPVSGIPAAPLPHGMPPEPIINGAPPLPAATTGPTGVDKIYADGYRMSPAPELANMVERPSLFKRIADFFRSLNPFRDKTAERKAFVERMRAAGQADFSVPAALGPLDHVRTHGTAPLGSTANPYLAEAIEPILAEAVEPKKVQRFLPGMEDMGAKAAHTAAPTSGIVMGELVERAGNSRQMQNAANTVIHGGGVALSRTPSAAPPSKLWNMIKSVSRKSWIATGIVAGTAAVIGTAYYLTSVARKRARVTEQKLNNADEALEKAVNEQMEANSNKMMGVDPIEAEHVARVRKGRGQAQGAEAAVQPPVPQVAEGQNVADLGAPTR